MSLLLRDRHSSPKIDHAVIVLKQRRKIKRAMGNSFLDKRTAQNGPPILTTGHKVIYFTKLHSGSYIHVGKEDAMKKIFVTAGIFLLVCIVSAAPVLAADPAGTIIALSGSATATLPNNKPRQLALKSPIYLNDRVATRTGSKLQIMFNDDSIISQGENSEITIDEYMYSPKDKAAVNCSVKIVKGLFRMVTGKITDINPDRFRVQTRTATIGIRGCDLGFKVLGDVEDVYILYLPEGKAIVVQKQPSGDNLNGLETSANSLCIVEDQVTVSISDEFGLVERPLTTTEAQQFFEMVSSDTARTDSRGKDSDPAADLAGSSQAAATPAEAVAATASQTDSSGQTQGQYDDIQLAAAPADRPSLSDAPVDQTPTSGPGSSDKPSSNPSNPTQPLPPLPPTLIASGGGMGHDWVWGIYSDGKMESALSFASSWDYLTVGSFQAIADGTILHVLSGSGTAGALIQNAGVNKLVKGTCSLNITVGQKSVPIWDGTFAMNNAGGDKLDFKANGNILSGGLLRGTPNQYVLTAGGTDYGAGSLMAQRIEGRLIGSGVEPTPITAASGQFAFQHSATLRADGVFGSDLH